MKNLKWVFYFESVLIGITVILGVFYGKCWKPLLKHVRYVRISLM